MQRMSLAQGEALYCRKHSKEKEGLSLRSVAKPIIGLVAIQLCGLSACSDPHVDEPKRVRISSLRNKAGFSQKTESQENGVVTQKTESADPNIPSLPEFTYTLPPPPIPPFDPKELSVALAVHCGRCHDWVFKKDDVIAYLKKNNLDYPYKSIQDQITSRLMPKGNSQFAQSETGKKVLELLDSL